MRSTHGHDVGRVGAREQHAELVAAEARDRVRRAQRAARAGAPTSMQQLVAGGVAERVVDLLEAVEVHEQHGDALAVAARASRTAWSMRSRKSVRFGEAGERVVQRLVLVELGLARGAPPRPPGAAVTSWIIETAKLRRPSTSRTNETDESTQRTSPSLRTKRWSRRSDSTSSVAPRKSARHEVAVLGVDELRDAVAEQVLEAAAEQLRIAGLASRMRPSRSAMSMPVSAPANVASNRASASTWSRLASNSAARLTAAPSATASSSSVRRSSSPSRSSAALLMT